MHTQAEPDLAHRTGTVPASRTPPAQPADADPHRPADLDLADDLDLAADLDLPFGWEDDPVVAQPDDRDAVFRFPAADDPEPRAGRVLGMAAWATGLGVLGLGTAARGGLAMLTTTVPHWYATAGIASGLLGIALTVGAFLSVHRARTPWLLLGLATLPLAANLTVNALVL